MRPICHRNRAFIARGFSGAQPPIWNLCSPCVLLIHFQFCFIVSGVLWEIVLRDQNAYWQAKHCFEGSKVLLNYLNQYWGIIKPDTTPRHFLDFQEQNTAATMSNKRSNTARSDQRKKRAKSFFCAKVITRSALSIDCNVWHGLIVVRNESRLMTNLLSDPIWKVSWLHVHEEKKQQLPRKWLTCLNR